MVETLHDRKQQEDRIAQVALHHYNCWSPGFSASAGRSVSSYTSPATTKGTKPTVPPSLRGKPKADCEWTVYAALVAVRSIRDHRTTNESSNQKAHWVNDLQGDDDDDAVSPNHSSDGGDDVWVVSCATGTKCTGPAHRRSGWIVHDCHAEVLCRRGLVRALLDEIHQCHHHLRCDAASHQSRRLLLERVQRGQSDDSSGLEQRSQYTEQQAWRQFRLRSDIQLHLYVSDSPCGDASIYEIETPGTPTSTTTSGRSSHSSNDPCTTTVHQFTGSKLVVSSSIPCVGTTEDTTSCAAPSSVEQDGCSHAEQVPSGSVRLQVLSSTKGGSLLVREAGNLQLVGKIRTKSSRSNVANRSSSMSCSDKICRWQVLGWQGAMLLTLVPDPIRVVSVLVSRDPRGAGAAFAGSDTPLYDFSQEAALQRALVDRVQGAMKFVLSTSDDDDPNPSPACSRRAQYVDCLCRDWNAVSSLPFHTSIVDVAFEQGKSQTLHRRDFSGPSASLSPSLNSDVRKRKHPEAETLLSSSSSSSHRPIQDPQVSNRKVSPCGFCLNWNVTFRSNAGEDYDDPNSALPEVLVGARGIRQGKIPSTDAQYRALQSRLSRASLARAFTMTMGRMVEGTVETRAITLSSSLHPPSGRDEPTAFVSPPPATYRGLKRAVAPPGYWVVRDELFRNHKSPLSGWLVSDEDGDFAL